MLAAGLAIALLLTPYPFQRWALLIEKSIKAKPDSIYRIEVKARSQGRARIWIELAGIESRYFVEPGPPQLFVHYAKTGSRPAEKLRIKMEQGVEIEKIKWQRVCPLHWRHGKIALGYDEAIYDGTYRWHSNLYRRCPNCWRPLKDFSFKIVKNYIIFEKNDYAVFDFSLPGLSQKEATLNLIINEIKGPLLVEQRYGKRWHLVAVISQELGQQVKLRSDAPPLLKIQATGYAKLIHLSYRSQVNFRGEIYGNTYFASSPSTADFEITDFHPTALTILAKRNISLKLKIEEEKGKKIKEGEIFLKKGHREKIGISLAEAGFYILTLAGTTRLYFYFPEIFTASKGGLLFRNEHFSAWWEQASRKVGRGQTPPASSGLPVVKLPPGGRAAFQLVFRPRWGLRLFRFTWKRPRQLRIKIYRVMYVPVRLPSDDRGFPAPWPDPLLPIAPTHLNIALHQNETHPFWVEFIAHPKARRKTFTVPFKVETSAGDFCFSVKVKITPGKERKTLIAGVVPPGPHSPASPSLPTFPLREILGLLGEHSTPSLLSPPQPGLKIKDGKLLLDFEPVEEFVEECLKANPLSLFRLRLPEKFGPYEKGSPRYGSYLAQYARAYEDFLEKKGWLKKFIIYEMDEPLEEEYPQVKALLQQIKSAFKKLPVMLTEQPEPFFYGLVDIWVPVLHLLVKKEIEKRRQAGQQVWTYICTEPRYPFPNIFIDQPGRDHLKLLSWMNRFGIKHLFYYNCARAALPSSLSSAWHNPCSFTRYGFPLGNGDGFLIYFIKQNTRRWTPIPSIRLKLLSY